MFEMNFDFDYNSYKLNAIIDCFHHEEEELRMELINHMEKLYDELVVKLGDTTDDARDLLKRQIKNALDRIVVEGKPSVRTKLLEQADGSEIHFLYYT